MSQLKHYINFPTVRFMDLSRSINQARLVSEWLKNLMELGIRGSGHLWKDGLELKNGSKNSSIYL